MKRSARFGQNFLINKKVAEKIVKIFFPVHGIILEIGAGNGILTDFLYKYRKGNKIIAVEFDRELFVKIEKRYGCDFEVINANILEINLNDNFYNKNINLISNIPYYISKDIIDWVIFNRNKIKKGIFMMQKEFVNKLIKKEDSAQSILFRFLFYSKRLFDVNPGSFYPQPKIDSAVVRFIIHPWGVELDEKRFWQLIRMGFSSKRRTLINNLSNGLKIDKKVLKNRFRKFGLDENIRAEKLEISDWVDIIRSDII